jgi:hypothetical protein
MRDAPQMAADAADRCVIRGSYLPLYADVATRYRHGALATRYRHGVLAARYRHGVLAARYRHYVVDDSWPDRRYGLAEEYSLCFR